MAPEPTHEDLLDAYMLDPMFHALVTLHSTGWTDEEGVYFYGPTIADARRVARFLQMVDSLGFKIVPKG